MKLLVIGASGLLGSRVAGLASKEHEVYGTCSSHELSLPNSLKLDVTNQEEVKKTVSELKPQAVVNCAAMTNVDGCEREPEKARALNSFAPQYLANACQENECKLVHVSTDYVFDGEKGNYSEKDRVSAKGVYAESKLAAEIAVKTLCADRAIARVSVLYGWKAANMRENFVTWAIKELEAGKRIRLVTDQYTSPTLADNAAEAILAIIDKNERGVFHTCGSTCLDRYSFGLKIAEAFGLDASLIDKTTSKEFEWLAPRPSNSCMLNNETQKRLGVKLYTVEEGLKFMREQKERGDYE